MRPPAWWTVLTTINGILDRAMSTVAAIFLTIIVVAVCVQVAGRYVLFVSVSWSEELAVYSFIWMVLLGSAVGVREHTHLVADLLPEHLGPLLDRLIPTLTYVVIAIITYVFLVYGWEYAMLGRSRLSENVAFPMVYLYIALPITAAAMVLFLIERVGITWFDLPSEVAAGKPEIREA